MDVFLFFSTQLVLVAGANTWEEMTRSVAVSEEDVPKRCAVGCVRVLQITLSLSLLLFMCDIKWYEFFSNENIIILFTMYTPLVRDENATLICTKTGEDDAAKLGR